MKHKDANSSGLYSHLRRSHPDVCRSTDVSITESQIEPQQSIPNLFQCINSTVKHTDEQKTEDVYKSILCFIKNNIPYQVLDNEYFRGLPGLRVPPGLNRTSLSKRVIDLAQEVEDAMFTRLKYEDICLMIDGGTLIRRKLLHIMIGNADVGVSSLDQSKLIL